MEDLDWYNQAPDNALEVAPKNAVVIFWLKPTKLEISYCYIQIQNNKVLGFQEKPNKETAEEFLKVGNFDWNSSM